MDYRNRAALGWICERLPAVYRLVARAGKRAELDVLLSDLRSGRRDFASGVDRIEELLRHCGWSGALRTGSVPSLGLGAGFALEEAYICPREDGLGCARAVPAVDVNGDEGPWCEIDQAPLRLEQFGR